MAIFKIISETIQSQFGVSPEKADQSTRNIITNFAHCAGASVDKVQDTHDAQIRISFDGCFAGAHNKNKSDVDGFEKDIIACMCNYVKSSKAQ